MVAKMENGADTVSESVHVAANGVHKINGASATSAQASSLKVCSSVEFQACLTTRNAPLEHYYHWRSWLHRLAHRPFPHLDAQVPRRLDRQLSQRVPSISGESPRDCTSKSSGESDRGRYPQHSGAVLQSRSHKGGPGALGRQQFRSWRSLGRDSHCGTFLYDLPHSCRARSIRVSRQMHSDPSFLASSILLKARNH